MKAKANGNYTEASFSEEISAQERVTKDQISWERLSRALLLVWRWTFLSGALCVAMPFDDRLGGSDVHCTTTAFAH